MKKQRLPRPRGAAIDLVHTWIRHQILTLKREIAILERKGTLLAYPHFKAGTKRMYLLEPTDGRNGKRKYHYIGGNEKEQKLAFEKIERYHKAKMLSVMLSDTERWLSENKGSLDRLLHSFMMTHRSAEKAIKDGEKFTWIHGAIVNGVTPRSSGGPRPVTQDPVGDAYAPADDERACRVCGCTEYTPCPGGCSWVEEDLCSSPECVKAGNKSLGPGGRSRYPGRRKR